MARSAGESWDVCLPGDPPAFSARVSRARALRRTYGTGRRTETPASAQSDFVVEVGLAGELESDEELEELLEEELLELAPLLDPESALFTAPPEDA